MTILAHIWHDRSLVTKARFLSVDGFFSQRHSTKTTGPIVLSHVPHSTALVEHNFQDVIGKRQVILRKVVFTGHILVKLLGWGVPINCAGIKKNFQKGFSLSRQRCLALFLSS